MGLLHAGVLHCDKSGSKGKGVLHNVKLVYAPIFYKFLGCCIGAKDGLLALRGPHYGKNEVLHSYRSGFRRD